MTAPIPSSVPTQIRAGDTAQWTRDLGDYPASEGWTLEYALVSSSARQVVTATADGDTHAVTVAAATTAPWTAGTYRVHEYVSKDAERFTIGTYTVRVLPDLAVAPSGLDSRTHARKVLDLIEAWLESRAPVAGKFVIADRTIENYPIADLLVLRDRYRAEVAREVRIENGRAPLRVLTRL